MAKRFTDITIWDDDWFFELSPEYKLFWFYLKDNCDHAGIWKPKVRAFKSATDIEIDLEKAIAFFNTGKQRVRILSNGYWFLEDFFFFQYVKSARCMNLGNRVHESVFNLYVKMGILLSTVNGIDFVTDKNKETHAVGDFERMAYDLTSI